MWLGGGAIYPYLCTTRVGLAGPSGRRSHDGTRTSFRHALLEAAADAEKVSMVVDEVTEDSIRMDRAPARAVAQPAARALGVVIYLVLGGVAAIATGIGLFGSYEPIVMLVLGLAALLALILSAWLRRPSRLWPWVAIASALALFIISALARAAYGTLGNLTASRSLVPDLIVLPGYLLLAAGLFGFAPPSEHRPRDKSSIVLDGVIAALSFAALAWVFAIEPVLARHSSPLSLQLVLIAYPSTDLFLLVVTMRIAFSRGSDPVPAYWLLLAALSLMFVGDALYVFADLDLFHYPAGILDLPYALAYLCAGAAAMHPSMRSLTEPNRRRPATTSRGRIALVAVALLVPALLMLSPQIENTTTRWGLFLILLALGAAAVLRIVWALNAAAHSEARLVFQATHDGLTGLPNRLLMEQHLTRLLEQPAADVQVALLFLDLDRFKLVNDTLGHSHGDELLVRVAERLRANVKSTDMVTRIGGDEFMIVLGDVVSVSQALDMANRLRLCLRDPFMVGDMDFYVTASIGLAFASGDDVHATSEALVRDADTAMYQAKDAGRDAVAVFDESMRKRITERMELESDLRSAVALDQLFLVYQPIVRLPAGPVIGVEALVRWLHPTYGVIPPAKFIPLAEESGLIGEIGSWVLEEAVAQLALWSRRSPELEPLYVSVNLSGAQLRDELIVQRVREVITANGLPGSSVALELTESVLMEDPDAAAVTLGELRKLGVRVAIDDFGSEYSSLAYLKRFPATILKIDKSFVDGLVQADSADATLIAAVVAMGRALGITTMAEGVETAAQAKRLLELGCEEAQGFLYSRPVRADKLLEVVESLRAHGLHAIPDRVRRQRPEVSIPTGSGPL